MKQKRIVTSLDYARQRRAREARANARAYAAHAEKQRVQAILNDNPHIGVIVRRGRQLYYIMQPNGMPLFSINVEDFVKEPA